jgi:hypothetical protein
VSRATPSRFDERIGRRVAAAFAGRARAALVAAFRLYGFASPRRARAPAFNGVALSLARRSPGLVMLPVARAPRIVCCPPPVGRYVFARGMRGNASSAIAALSSDLDVVGVTEEMDSFVLLLALTLRWSDADQHRAVRRRMSALRCLSHSDTILRAAGFRSVQGASSC